MELIFIAGVMAVLFELRSAIGGGGSKPSQF